MELITMSDGTPILRPEISSQIAEFERKVKEIGEQEKALKKAILEEMEAKNIIGIETPELKITYVAPYDKESFDTKALRKDMPDVYDEYVRISPVKSSIRLKARDE